LAGSVILACTVLWIFGDEDAGRKSLVADIEVGCCNGVLWLKKKREVWVE